ncbi:thioredoxin family protein [Cryobacterium tagatosivorans]|uniref:Thioredoxin family protein n=1 Tax=Cryobacterium tagatosivorans TaxID=1259199 RepID=A0A4R8UIS0_9MICO|nr:thioredoxin family protein [Cryobacterium tagatosivorans]TFB54180.1 thioredoxin family protein [Cryobacterium tagatosivorans]
MKAEILHIDDCPSWEEAGRRLRVALDSTGHQDTAITYTLIASSATAAQVPFAGSPTILLDGTDLFPSAGRINDLACRVYMTPEGLAGRPTQEQVQEALASHG